MRNGVKSLISLLTALGVSYSLIVPSAFAKDSPPGKTSITITVENEVRQYRQDNPAAWSYSITEGRLAEGDSIDDLVNGPPTCDADSKSDVGEYPIILAKKQEVSNYDVTVVNGTLTVDPATVTSFSPPDDMFAPPNGYWKTIYASSAYNSEEGLIHLLSTEKGSYRVGYGDSDTVDLNAGWRADEDNAAFDPKGRQKAEWGDVWYSYTADLTAKNEADAKRFEVSVDSPKAYVRVIPVNAAQTLTPSSATLTTADIESLKDKEAMNGTLGLPQTAAVTYIPGEAPGWYEGETKGEYTISCWKLDNGQALTLETLRSIAAGVAEGQEAEVVLSPVYASAGKNAVPDWATLEEAPRFTLLITGKLLANAVVRAPDSITYGETLGDCAIELDSGIGTVTYKYIGVDGTKYDSAEKPSNAGSYRVTAALTSDTHSGRWTSETFTIAPKTVTVTGITGKAREYDGGTNANAVLNAARAVIKGRVDGDDLHATASGYFVDKNVGTNKDVVIVGITLTGGDADNYVLAEKGSQTRTTASITPKLLEIDDSQITVTKKYDGTVYAGALEGRLKLKGVVNGEVRLDSAKVRVGPFADPNPGGNKTVALYGLALDGFSHATRNYSLTGIHMFTKAEITTKSHPVLNADFTVAIPKVTYDGQRHAAAITTEDGVTGLGAATITYAKQKPDGTYDAPTVEEPVNAGNYQVIVSFEEGADFSAMEGRNAINAGILTIKKANADAAMTIIVPVAATNRTIQLKALDLPADMIRGAKIREIPSVSGDVLREAAGGVGDTAFTLKTRAVKDDKSQNFDLVLRSDNYAKLTVTITVVATTADIEITPPAVTVKNAAPEYGTPLEDIIALEGGSATLNGVRIPGTFTLPDKLYDVGAYTDTDIEVLFHSNDGNYQNVPIKVNATFTVQKASLTSFSADELLVRYITIYADDPSNISAEGLKNLIATSTENYTARYKYGSVELKPTWSAVSTGKPYHFDPKGKTANVWYSYVASLSMSKDTDAEHFIISPDIGVPEVYIRVIPINAVQTLTLNSAVLTLDAVKALENEADMIEALGLPQMVTVTYAPAQYSKEIIDQAGEYTSTVGEYSISGWKIGGKPLTLKALKNRAAGASRRDVEVTLTPVCSGAPTWATEINTPEFKLKIITKVRYNCPRAYCVAATPCRAD